MNSDYGTARLVLKIIGIVGYVAIAIGVIGGVIGFIAASGYMVGIGARFAALLTGLGPALAGLFAVGFSQIGHAILDGSQAVQRTHRHLSGESA